MLLCYGGLRVDGTTLLVKTRVSCWEHIAIYQNKEEETEALLKIKNAIQCKFCADCDKYGYFLKTNASCYNIITKFTK